MPPNKRNLLQELMMLGKPCRIGECTWGKKDSFCDILEKTAVPHDSKWPLVLLYLRGIKDNKALSEVQKNQMQELLLSIIQAKDFSESHYDAVQASVISIITRPYKDKLQEMLRETTALAKDMHDMLGTHQHGVSSIVCNIDTELSKEDNPTRVLTNIRDALKDILLQMEQDVSSLTSLSYKDSLTGLANRRSFDKFLDACVESWKSEQTKLSLILFDIDHFKGFNDTYGHLVGDQVLRTLAAQAQSIIATFESDSSQMLAARYGGEEFAVVLSGEIAEQSVHIAEQLRCAIQKTNLLLRGSDNTIVKSGLRITISLGVADIRPQWEGAYQTNLVDCADKALYHAKSNGRNCTVLYTPEAPEAYSLVSTV